MANVDLRSAGFRGGTLSTRDVVVVGAGWAGLSAAVHATRAGLRVHLLESAPHAGGRARAARLDFGSGPIELDAGQHLLMGAYRECLALASIVSPGGANGAFERLPLSLRDTAGLRIEATRWPAPLHLLGALARARGLRVADRWAALRLIAALRTHGWRVRAGETVSGLLERHRQPAALVERVWAPLCIGALNTPPEDACALAFATVLRDTIGAARDASDFVLPRTTLAASLSQPACAWLQAHGASVSFGATVRSIAPAGARWRVRTGARAFDADDVVLAVPARSAARLLGPLDVRAVALEGFAHESIATVYLAWPRTQPLPLPRWILLRDDGHDAHGQWLFDRGCCGEHRIAAVVVSLRSRLDAQEPEAIADSIARQVARELELPLPTAHRTVTEKRATFRCTPGRPRMACDAFADALPGLWLAGDYVDAQYPATLEASVRSGREAAARLRSASREAQLQAASIA